MKYKDYFAIHQERYGTDHVSATFRYRQADGRKSARERACVEGALSSSPSNERERSSSDPESKQGNPASRRRQAPEETPPAGLQEERRTNSALQSVRGPTSWGRSKLQTRRAWPSWGETASRPPSLLFFASAEVETGAWARVPAREEQAYFFRASNRRLRTRLRELYLVASIEGAD